MKSLKRTLSLVLALVMVLGLFGGLSINAAASTEDFTDGEDVQYKEAVDVLTAIGAISGFTDGTFKPKDTIRRADAAKLVVYATLGKDAAERLPAGVNSRYSDVDSNWAWAAPSIEYLAEAGVIDGMGDGTFHPADPITGYAIVKMLLCSIGYGAKNEFVGPGWDLNVAIYGSVAHAGIIADRVAGSSKLDSPATREEVALYCLNAIQAQRKVYVSTLDMYVNADAGSLGNGGKATLMEEIYGADNGRLTKNVYSSGYGFARPANNDAGYQGTYGAVDQFGRPATEWKFKGQTISLIAETPVLSYPQSVKKADLEKDIWKGGYTLDLTNRNFKFVENSELLASGLPSTDPDYVANINAYANLGDTAYVSSSGASSYLDSSLKASPYGAGVKTEVFANDIGTIEAIVVTYQTLSYVTEVDKDGASFTILDPKTPGNKITVTADTLGFKGVCQTASALLAADQPCPVLLTLNENTISKVGPTQTVLRAISVSIPEKVEGEIKTAKFVDDASVGILGTVVSYALTDGTTKYAAAGAPQGDYTTDYKGLMGTSTAGKATFYVDEFGFVMACVPSDAALPTVGLLLAADWEDDLFGNVQWYAKILALNGEEVVLEVNKTNLRTASETGYVSPNVKEENAETIWRPIFNKYVGTLVQYSTVSGSEGKFNVGVIDDIKSVGPGNNDVTGVGSENTAGIKVTQNRASVTEKESYNERFVADSTTIFLVAQSKAANYKGWTEYTAKTYNGIKEVESSASNYYSALCVGYGEGKRLAQVIAVVNPDGAAAAAKDLGLLVVRDELVNKGNGIEAYDAVLIDGDKSSTVSIDTADYESIRAQLAAAGTGIVAGTDKGLIGNIKATAPITGSEAKAEKYVYKYDMYGKVTNNYTYKFNNDPVTLHNDSNVELEDFINWFTKRVEAAVGTENWKVEVAHNSSRLGEFTVTVENKTAKELLPSEITKTTAALAVNITARADGASSDDATKTTTGTLQSSVTGANKIEATKWIDLSKLDRDAIETAVKKLATAPADDSAVKIVFNDTKDHFELHITTDGTNGTKIAETAEITWKAGDKIELPMTADGSEESETNASFGKIILRKNAGVADFDEDSFNASGKNMMTYAAGLETGLKWGTLPKTSSVLVLKDWTLNDDGDVLSNPVVWQQGDYKDKLVVDAGVVIRKDSNEVVTLGGATSSITQSFTHADDVKVWNIDLSQSNVANMVTSGTFSGITRSAMAAVPTTGGNNDRKFGEGAVWIRNIDENTKDQTIRNIFILKGLWDTTPDPGDSSKWKGLAEDAVDEILKTHGISLSGMGKGGWLALAQAAGDASAARP